MFQKWNKINNSSLYNKKKKYKEIYNKRIEKIKCKI